MVDLRLRFCCLFVTLILRWLIYIYICCYVTFTFVYLRLFDCYLLDLVYIYVVALIPTFVIYVATILRCLILLLPFDLIVTVDLFVVTLFHILFTLFVTLIVI